MAPRNVLLLVSGPNIPLYPPSTPSPPLSSSAHGSIRLVPTRSTSPSPPSPWGRLPVGMAWEVREQRYHYPRSWSLRRYPALVTGLFVTVVSLQLGRPSVDRMRILIQPRSAHLSFWRIHGRPWRGGIGSLGHTVHARQIPFDFSKALLGTCRPVTTERGQTSRRELSSILALPPRAREQPRDFWPGQG